MTAFFVTCNLFGRLGVYVFMLRHYIRRKKAICIKIYRTFATSESKIVQFTSSLKTSRFSMKRNLTPKSLILFCCAVSLSAFLFVNLHASLSLKDQLPQGYVPTAQVQGNGDEEDQPGRLPDFSIFGKLLLFVERVIPFSR